MRIWAKERSGKFLPLANTQTLARVNYSKEVIAILRNEPNFPKYIWRNGSQKPYHRPKTYEKFDQKSKLCLPHSLIRMQWSTRTTYIISKFLQPITARIRRIRSEYCDTKT